MNKQMRACDHTIHQKVRLILNLRRTISLLTSRPIENNPKTLLCILMEEIMRRTALVLFATLAVLVSGSLVSGPANAMTLSTPAAVQAAIDDSSLAQDVAYVCRRAWRCGYWGCGWRRACYWTGGHYYGRRHYWRHRHYWHHRHYY
jgi:hypothetical protein